MAAASTAGAPIVCKAAVMWEPKAPLAIEEVTVDPPKAGEVRVKIQATAVCHTDLYTWEGSDPEMQIPCILGHEGIGVVESVGEGVTSCKVGDTVIPLYTPECGECKFCTATGAKRTNLCARIRGTQGKGVMPDGSVRFHAKRGGAGEVVDIKHFMGCSTFAEYTVVAAISLVVVPSGIDLERACLFGCGVTTGYGAVTNTAKFEAGSTAAVFGLGGVGLAVLLGLKDAGARRIIAVDLNEAKFAKARELVPEVECVNPADAKYGGKKVEEIIIEMTTEADVSGSFGGVDYSFDCTGNVKVMQAALECTHRAWGKSVIIGVAAAGQMITTRPFYLVVGRSWTGTAFGGVKGRSELPGIMDKLLPKMGAFVTHTFDGVAALNDAFHLMHDPAANCIRPVLRL